MPDRSRIPTTLVDFDVYINTTDNFLQAIDPTSSQPNWQRLELKAAEANWWNTQRLFWRDTLYKKRGDKRLRTLIVNADVKDFRAAFKKQSARILDKIAVADAADNRDEAVFKLVLKKHRKKPGRHQTPIEESVAIVVRREGGGRLHFICRASDHAKRAAIPKTANSVEIGYSIGEAIDCDHTPHRIISTHASFSHDFAGAHIGKYIYVYARWYNTKHPRLAGPWSELMKVMIA
jgi:hypothetical protein